MTTLIVSLEPDNPLAHEVAAKINAQIADITVRHFPDGETYVKYNQDVIDTRVIIFDSLDNPDKKIMPLLFLAKTAKELGASTVGFCAPYLSYMRQDIRFKPGEAITSNYFAELISAYFDWLVTIDPHLHRHKSLDEIYTIPSRCLHASDAIAHWLADRNKDIVLIGPDSESEQWVSAIADTAQCPYVILDKDRKGDYDVSVSQPKFSQYLSRTPVLVDDIISTAHTMVATVKNLKELQMKPPLCIGIHAIFAGEAYQLLEQAGVKDVITCNSIHHKTNKIDLSDLLSSALKAI